MFLTNQDFLRPNKGSGDSWVGVGGQGHPQSPFPKSRLPAIGGTKYKILLHSVYGGYSRKWVLSDYAMQPLSHYGSMLITFFFIIKVGPSLLATPSLVSRKNQSINHHHNPVVFGPNLRKKEKAIIIIQSFFLSSQQLTRICCFCTKELLLHDPKYMEMSGMAS